MNSAQLKLLVMQSAFHKDCNTIIDLIAPIVCDKKITKREINKANKELLHHFGEYEAYRNDASELKLAPHYTLFLSHKEAYTSRKLIIYKHHRFVRGGESTYYMHEYTRTIYLEGGSISNEVLQKYKFDNKYMPTEKQIVKVYAKYEAINAKIKKLEDERSELPFHYYFNRKTW